MIVITTARDIDTHLANERGDLTNAERSRAVEALRASDHPAWGDDWEQWLVDSRSLVDEAACAVERT